MQQLIIDETTGQVMFSIDVKLRDGVGDRLELGHDAEGLALKVESADLWHLRMGHINRKSLDALRKLPGNGVEYDVDMKECGTCLVGKSEQQTHPKQATYDVQRPFELVTVDTMGPITPQALGGYSYVTKFVNQQTKWKEIFFINDKTLTVDSLEMLNKALVIPTGERLVCLKGDKGTQFTSGAFRQYCHDTGLKLEFASPNTPQQIGANERAGRALAGIVRCLLSDSGLPRFLWGELMQTAAYLSNRSPHACPEEWYAIQATLRQGGLPRQPSGGRGEGVRACGHPHQEIGASRLGRKPCWVQLGKQVVSGLQSGDEKCTGDSKCHFHRDVFRHARTGSWWFR